MAWYERDFSDTFGTELQQLDLSLFSIGFCDLFWFVFQTESGDLNTKVDSWTQQLEAPPQGSPNL